MRIATAIGCIVAASLSGCSKEPTPEPSPTLRAAHCFDGTLENGCPDFRNPPPRTVATVTVVDKSTLLVKYADGTSETLTFER